MPHRAPANKETHISKYDQGDVTSTDADREFTFTFLLKSNENNREWGLCGLLTLSLRGVSLLEIMRIVVS